MGATATTTEATMSVIQESLVQLGVTLGRIAARQDQMLVDMKKRTAALVSTATTTPMFRSGRVLEQQRTEPSPSSLFSAIQVVGAGAAHADAVFAATMPTLCSTEGPAQYTDSGHAELVFPSSGSTPFPATTLTPAGTGTNSPASCSTQVVTSPREGFVDDAPTVNTDRPCNNSLPRFDGTNPCLWRAHCLQYFTHFNIHKCMWVVAASLHMDGKAKEWYEAYRLAQVVGAWTEFINDVEAHFGVSDFPQSTTMLGAAHPTSVVHTSADISPDTTYTCLPARLKEVMITVAEPTLVQPAEGIELQFAQLKLALTSEFEEHTYLGNVTQMAETIVDSSEEVVTHVSGVSLFLELQVEPVEAEFSKTTLMEDYVFTNVGGSSLFLEIGLDSENEELANTKLTHVGDCFIFLQAGMGDTTEVFDAPLTVGMDKVLGHRVGVPSKRCTLQQLLSHEMQQHGTNCHTVVLPWDPGQQKAGIKSLFGLRYHAHKCVIRCNMFVDGRSVTDVHPLQLVTNHVLDKMPPWTRGGFSPGDTVQSRLYKCMDLYSLICYARYVQYKQWDPGVRNCANITEQYAYYRKSVDMVGHWMLGQNDDTDVLLDGSEGAVWDQVLAGILSWRIHAFSFGNTQQLKYCWAWAPDCYMLQVAVSNLISVKVEGANLYVSQCQLLNEALQAGHVYLTHDILGIHATVGWRHTSYKLQLQWLGDPGDVHTNTLCSRFTRSILCVALGRPWDPGIVAIREGTVLADISSEIGATMWDEFTEPLLEGKQCFFGAVMSCPHMERHCALSSWAMAQVDWTSMDTKGWPATVIDIEEQNRYRVSPVPLLLSPVPFLPLVAAIQAAISYGGGSPQAAVSLLTSR